VDSLEGNAGLSRSAGQQAGVGGLNDLWALRGFPRMEEMYSLRWFPDVEPSMERQEGGKDQRPNRW